MNKEFEFSFFQNEKENAIFLLRLGTIINIIQSMVLLAYYIIEDEAKQNDRIVAIAFFILGTASWGVKSIVKRWKKIVNISLFAKNIIACLLVGISQIIQEEDLQRKTINYQPLLGIILTIELLTNIQGTNFLYKISLCAVNLTFYGLAFYGERSIGLVFVMSFGAIYFLSYTYQTDKQKRQLFLDKQKSIELSFLIDKLLPINMVVMKYNPKEERSFLHQVNRKAQNTFTITDNDTFKNFSKSVIIKQETNQNDIENSTNHLFSGKNAANNALKEQEKTLFFYVESIAKENFLRSKKEQNKQNDKRQSIKSESNSRGTRTDRGGSISKIQRNKMNSIDRPKKLSDDNKNNEKIYSQDNKVKRPSMFDPSKFSSTDRNKNNSIDSPKVISIERPKVNSIERNVVGSIEKSGNLEQMNFIKTFYDYKIGNPNRKNSQEKSSNPPVITRNFQRQSTVKIDLNSNNVDGGSKFTRRLQKKGTIMRKMSNFNLKPGLANATSKYGEDVYDRIDILQGVYTQKDGNQRIIQIKIYTYNVDEQYQVILIEDETLEGQVKYQSELNRFLYKSFQESLEQFRIPLAYTLIKLNDGYEHSKNHKEEKFSPASCTNLNAYNQNNIIPIRADGRHQSLSNMNQSEFSLSNISPMSRHHKNLFPNISQFHSQINNFPNKVMENLSGRYDETQYSQSMNNLNSYMQEQPLSSRRRAASQNDQSEKFYESIENTRYYGFLTLNSIYNYIDYITLLQQFYLLFYKFQFKSCLIQ